MFAMQLPRINLLPHSKIAIASEDIIVPPNNYSRSVLSESEMNALEQLYMKLTQKEFTPCSIFAKYSSL